MGTVILTALTLTRRLHPLHRRILPTDGSPKKIVAPGSTRTPLSKRFAVTGPILTVTFKDPYIVHVKPPPPNKPVPTPPTTPTAKPDLLDDDDPASAPQPQPRPPGRSRLSCILRLPLRTPTSPSAPPPPPPPSSVSPPSPPPSSTPYDPPPRTSPSTKTVPPCIRTPVLKKAYPTMMQNVERYGNPNITLGCTEGTYHKTIRPLAFQNALSPDRNDPPLPKKYGPDPELGKTIHPLAFQNALSPDETTLLYRTNVVASRPPPLLR